MPWSALSLPFSYKLSSSFIFSVSYPFISFQNNTIHSLFCISLNSLHKTNGFFFSIYFHNSTNTIFLTSSSTIVFMSVCLISTTILKGFQASTWHYMRNLFNSHVDKIIWPHGCYRPFWCRNLKTASKCYQKMWFDTWFVNFYIIYCY